LTFTFELALAVHQ